MSAIPEPSAAYRAPTGGILKRALRNTGLLLGGKGAAGLMQLGTFAIAARGLGIHDFGVLSVALAQVMLLTGLASFDSNQAVIRYGVRHLLACDRAGFQALLKAGTLLDFGAAGAAALGSYLAAPFVGRHLGWNGELVAAAQLAALVAFGSAISTTKGVLRLFDRYDLLASQATVTPALRLASFAILAMLHHGLTSYIVAWIVAAWCGAVVAVRLAWRESARRGLLAGMSPRLHGLSAANPGVWTFSLFANLNTSVALIPTQLAVLIVSAQLGVPAAGIFRVAREIGTGMLKPVELVNQALLADVARLVAAREWARLARTGIRAGIVACLVGAAVTMLIVVAGEPIVAAVFGRGFVPAVPLLVFIGAAMAVRVLAFTADPMMYALGRPQIPFLLSSATALLFVAILLWRLPVDGLIGAGWAYLAMGAAGAVLSAAFAWRAIGRERRIDRAAGRAAAPPS